MFTKQLSYGDAACSAPDGLDTRDHAVLRIRNNGKMQIRIRTHGKMQIRIRTNEKMKIRIRTNEKMKIRIRTYGKLWIWIRPNLKKQIRTKGKCGAGQNNGKMWICIRTPWKNTDLVPNQCKIEDPNQWKNTDPNQWKLRIRREPWTKS